MSGEHGAEKDAAYEYHYAEAERELKAALSGSFVGHGRENHIAAAQVHATLALAAATRAIPPTKTGGRDR